MGGRKVEPMSPHFTLVIKSREELARMDPEKLRDLVGRAYKVTDPREIGAIAEAWTTADGGRLTELARTGSSDVHDGIVHNGESPEEAIRIILANSSDLIIKGMAAGHQNAPADQRRYLKGDPSEILSDYASVANPKTLPEDVLEKTGDKDEVIRAAFVERFKRMTEES